MSLNRLDKTKMLPSGMSADLNHGRMAACFKFWLCCFHISIICFIWRQTVAGFRWDGWDKCAVELPTVEINFSSGRQTQSHWKISCSALPPFLTEKNRQSSVMAPAYCKASSSQWHGGGWSQCTGTWLHLHDHLRCKITGLGAKRWPLRLFSTVLIVSPSALPGVCSWQYNYCSVGRDKKICCLLSLPPTEHPAALHGLRG